MSAEEGPAAAIAALVEAAPVEAEAAPAEAWKRFSPSDINTHTCCARVWGGGAGGQCHRGRHEGTDFCVMHNNKACWRSHGRADGPIPEGKLQEFLKASKKTPKAPNSAATPSPKKRQAENSTGTPEGPLLKKPCGGAYGIFLAENRQAIKESLSERHGMGNIVGDTMKEASVRWKALPEDEKKVLQDQYEAMTAEYKAAPRKMKMKKEKEVLLSPDGEKLKRPCFGAFGVFMEENRESIKASLPADHKITDVAKQIGVLYKALAEDEKKDLKAKSKDKMATYKTAAQASKALVLQAARSEAAAAAPAPQQKLGKFVRSKIRRKRAW